MNSDYVTDDLTADAESVVRVVAEHECRDDPAVWCRPATLSACPKDARQLSDNPKSPDSRATVQCNSGWNAGGAARVGLRRGAGRVRAAAGRVADVVRHLQDGRRRTLVWNDGMLFHSAEWMTDS